jgi:hypothetical protein
VLELAGVHCRAGAAGEVVEGALFEVSQARCCALAEVVVGWRG